PGSRSTQPGSRSTQPGSRSTQPGSRSTQPGSRSTQPGSRSTQPGSRSTQPATRSTQPGSRSTQPGSRSTQPGSRFGQPHLRSQVARFDRRGRQHRGERFTESAQRCFDELPREVREEQRGGDQQSGPPVGRHEFPDRGRVGEQQLREGVQQENRVAHLPDGGEMAVAQNPAGESANAARCAVRDPDEKPRRDG